MAKQLKLLPEDRNDGEEWQELLSTIEAVDIPVEVLKYLRAHLNNGTTFLFPVKEWLEQGSTVDDIDEAITRWMDIKDKDILSCDFIIDIEKLKATVTEQTDRILKDLR